MIKLKSHLTGKRHVIWDWNGTLLDDVDAVVAVMGEILRRNGLPPLDSTRYREIFGFPVIEYYRKLGFDFEKVPFTELSDQFIVGYQRHAPAMSLHRGAKDLLTAIREAGLAQSVLSAAHEDYLLGQLAQHGIREFFGHVYGLSDHHAASKVERGKELMKAVGHSPAETVLIGDTDHDLEVGRELGVDVLLLADGHQSYERLRSVHDRVLESRH